ATEVLLDHLNGLSDGDPDMACATRLDPVTGEGINEDSFLYDECIKSVEEQLAENEWEGVASALPPADFTAELAAQTRVALVSLAGEQATLAQIASGSDGNTCLAAFCLPPEPAAARGSTPRRRIHPGHPGARGRRKVRA